MYVQVRLTIYSCRQWYGKVNKRTIYLVEVVGYITNPV